jgi:dihydropteroate synthase
MGKSCGSDPSNISMIWRHLQGEFELGGRPLLMGILNLTPDSFSDGGKYLAQDKALQHAESMIQAGAEILDLGGESTRPGAEPVAEAEELKRVLPVIKALKQAYPGTIISIDTYKAAVAERALEAGAAIINDVGAGLWDEKMVDVLRSTDAAYVCMHSQGRPGEMQNQPSYNNVAEEVLSFLQERKTTLMHAGLAEERLVFDVGIGFGKRLNDNLELLRHRDTFLALKRPLLWGLSRKSFISHLLNVPAQERLAGGLAAYATLLRHPGPQIWRVHDVAEHAQLIRMWEETTKPHLP